MKQVFQAIFAAILVSATLFTGCAKPQVSKSRAVYVAIKTPNLGISQGGFIDSLPSDNYRLQIYAAGQSFEELTVGESICQGVLLCLSAASFNERYLSKFYPPNLLRDILAAREIANLENSAIKFTANGFVQYAKSMKKYDITYEKRGGFQSFVDPPNKVKIILRNSE